MKKIISCLLVVSIILNFISASVVYAEPSGTSPDDSESSGVLNQPAAVSDGVAAEITSY